MKKLTLSFKMISNEPIEFNFEIAIDKNKFEALLENSEVDAKRPNSRKLFGAWISLFEPQISEKERIDFGLEVQIQSNVAKFYPGRKRSDAAFFR